MRGLFDGDDGFLSKLDYCDGHNLKFTKTIQIIHLQWVGGMVCKIYFIKTLKSEKRLFHIKHHSNRSEKWDICNIRQNEPAIPIFQIFLIQMSNTDSMTIQLFNPFVFIFNIKHLSYNPPGYKISLPFTLCF